MREALLKIIADEIEALRRARAEVPMLFPRDVALYPIPFFGNILQAEILTIALNPSRTEFVQDRHWLVNMDVNALYDRLTGYFHDIVRPHKWFDPLEKALSYLESSYTQNAAHVDLCTFPTKFYRKIGVSEVSAFWEMLIRSIPRFSHLLSFAQNVKLFLVVNYSVTTNNGKRTNVLNLLEKKVEGFPGRVNRTDAARLVVSECRPHEVTETVWLHRNELRDFLSSDVPSVNPTIVNKSRVSDVTNMKTSLELEDDLIAKLSAMARAAGVSMDKVLNDAVREGLPRISHSTPTKPKPFHQTTHKLGWFPGMTWDKIQETLLEEEAGEYRCSERVK